MVLRPPALSRGGVPARARTWPRPGIACADSARRGCHGKDAAGRWRRATTRPARRKRARGFSLGLGRETVPVVRQVGEIAADHRTDIRSIHGRVTKSIRLFHGARGFEGLELRKGTHPDVDMERQAPRCVGCEGIPALP